MRNQVLTAHSCGLEEANTEDTTAVNATRETQMLAHSDCEPLVSCPVQAPQITSLN